MSKIILDSLVKKLAEVVKEYDLEFTDSESVKYNTQRIRGKYMHLISGIYPRVSMPGKLIEKGVNE